MKISIISPDKEHGEAISRLLRNEKGGRSVHLVQGGLEQLGPVADQERPDLVILDGVCCAPAELTMLEQLMPRHPNMAYIMLCKTISPDFLINAMHIGVRDVLPLPVAPDALEAAVTRLEQKAAWGSKPRQKGKVLAFIACKGGSGATFIATNLGYILAAAYDKKVALLDLHLQFGDASLFLSDRMPATTLVDVASNILRLDAAFLASSMVQVLPNYGVLAAPEDPERSLEVKPEHIDVLLKLAVDQYDFVILDVGRDLSAVTVKALDRADMIFPVLQETLPFVRDARRLLLTLQSLGYAKDKIHVIVNRYDEGGDIRLKDVESVLDMKVYLAIPNSYKVVSAAVNQGVAVMKISSHDPVTRTLMELGKYLTQAAPARKEGWLSHLFGNG